MNVATMNDTVSKNQAREALRTYKEHRPKFDSLDWEMERIYRRIVKGEKVISVQRAIREAGVDDLGRPKLAICQAHTIWCKCELHAGSAEFGIHNPDDRWYRGGRIKIDWPGLESPHWRTGLPVARLPRIPPQHRPDKPWNYHLLWEADWESLPVDPMLLRRIGKDAWVVLAAWELTEVEMSVLRSHA